MHGRNRTPSDPRGFGGGQPVPSSQEQGFTFGDGECCQCFEQFRAFGDSDVAPGVDAAICSMRPIFSVSASRRRTLRRLLFTVFRATTNSHGSAGSGTSSKRRQATRNVSETTSCAL